LRLIIEERDSGGWHGQTVLGRVEKEETTRKYLVDINGKLPTILCEIDTSDSSLKKSYYYANAQILAQREHTANPAVYDEYFYVHDRLGSRVAWAKGRVRQIYDLPTLIKTEGFLIFGFCSLILFCADGPFV